MNQAAETTATLVERAPVSGYTRRAAWKDANGNWVIAHPTDPKGQPIKLDAEQIKRLTPA